MAIQLPNPGLGDGQTGDNEFVMWTKVKDNFTNTTHAANRLVGSEVGKIPLAEDIFKAANSLLTSYLTSASTDLNDLKAGTKHLVLGTAVNTSPFDTQGAVQVIKTYGHHANNTVILQEAQGFYTGQKSTRVYTTNGWSDWQPITTHTANYTRTTANGANVVVDALGNLMRSTSSERYKDILAPLELDDARYADAMALKPIVYRSTADADNPAYHYYSFSAEELGAYDPAFTLWRENETVTDADGNVTEQPLAERQAEGININALLAMSHAIAIKQGELIKGLQEQINALKLKLEV